MGQKLACPICGRDYKGKIGVGVHLKRSHTSEERAKLYLGYLTGLLPMIMAVVVFVSIVARINESNRAFNELVGGKG